MDPLEHFRLFGWARLPQAIEPARVAAMSAAVWDELAAAGILRDDPATWTVERPTRLQRVKTDPAFRAIGSAAVTDFIGRALAGAAWREPANWGAPFLAFPATGEWNLPTGGWHLDARFSTALDPATGVKTLALLADVAPRAGATLIVEGSHRLIERWFADRPPPPGASNAEMRRLLRAHPFIAALHEPGEPAARIARLMDRAEEDDGMPLRVVEATGSAGDVVVMHPLTLHAASPNCGSEPRLMISGGVTTDMWGWEAS